MVKGHAMKTLSYYLEMLEEVRGQISTGESDTQGSELKLWERMRCLGEEIWILSSFEQRSKVQTLQKC